MELLGEVLPLILYFLGGVLLFVVIVLVVKLIGTVERTNALLDDLQEKAQSLDGLFEAIDSVSDTISSVNMKVVTAIAGVVEKIFHKRKKKKIKEEENDEYE